MNKKVYVDLSQQDVQDIINAYEKDIEKFNEQNEILNQIKQYIEYSLDNPLADERMILEMILAKIKAELTEEIE